MSFHIKSIEHQSFSQPVEVYHDADIFKASKYEVCGSHGIIPRMVIFLEIYADFGDYGD